MKRRVVTSMALRRGNCDVLTQRIASYRTLRSLRKDLERLTRALHDCEAGILVTHSERERGQVLEMIKRRIEEVDQEIGKLGDA